MNNSGKSFVLGSAAAAAFAASLCCILPVLSIVLGVGAFGAAAFFETLRPILLIAAFAALGFGFYQVYFRREQCGEDEICARKPVGRANQLVLWMATIAIAGFALFPFYTGYLVSALDSNIPESSNQTIVSNETQNKTVIIEVEGMTCDGCASHINETLKKLKGVISAEASYKNKNVKVVYNSGQITLEDIKKAINEIGYVAR
ncbi:MAG: mercuric transporter MerT family protein [Acidobacteriota bacterium]|nr:mercuric transporter MerT family protein [Acidobacteriota bacterium]